MSARLKLKSRVGQNRILKFSAGQMSDVRRYFKACHDFTGVLEQSCWH